jgi:hypothetical protein
MPRFQQQIADTLAAPYRSEAFAEDLIELERRLPAPEEHWLSPYALPAALLLIAGAALLVA